jgi:beta-phosphoglucomutase-like phosphatase (HAD superfamily)
VEDSVPGLGAARAAGVPCVVVVNDYTRGQDFSGAALVVDGFGELDADALCRLTAPLVG